MTTLDTLRQNRAQAAIDAKWYEREAADYIAQNLRHKLLHLAGLAHQRYKHIDTLINLLENDKGKGRTILPK